MKLFHVSEDPGIEVFEPRLPPSPDSGAIGNAVWAIGEDHLPHYLLPRDCPRVTVRATAETAKEDRIHFLGHAGLGRLIAVEEVWRRRIEASTLFVYEFPAETFQLQDASAGYYISRQSVRPSAKRTVTDLAGEIIGRGIELRFVQNLWPLRDAAVASTLVFSIIRMRNALPRGAASAIV